jgi:hypothetical protein
VEGVGDHGLDCVRSAERFGGLGMPGGALVGQGAGFVFGVPGLQGGLLRQLHRLHRCRRPTMITLKPGRQLSRSLINTRRVDQRWFKAGSTPMISRTGRFAGSVSGRSANFIPSPVPKMVLQGGVIGL